MKDGAAKNSPQVAVLSLAQLLAEQPAAPPPGWIEPGLLPPQGILFVGGEPKVGKSLLVANFALALAAGQDRAGFSVPAARRVLICQARHRSVAQRAAGSKSFPRGRARGSRRSDRPGSFVLHARSG